ncbi:MAG: butyrate kinase [Phycisphaerae bacterium]|nr:butyrate kinase [Phycisphaerae bacterium]
MQKNLHTTETTEEQFPESVTDLVEIAGKLPGTTVIVPGGDRIEDLRLVESARDHGIITRAILVGQKEKIIHLAAELEIDIDPQDIINAQNDEEAGQVTVERVKAGGIDMILKGGISTPIINRHMLKLADRPTVSLTSIFDAAPIGEGRPMILTDAGMTTVCNFGRMVDLVDNAVDVAQKVLGLQRPRVAILSANEKQIPSLPSTAIGLELAKRHWDNAIVCGPLSFDLATDQISVVTKGMPDLPNAKEVAGRADVLVCPGIDAANILYKSIASMTKYGMASIAGITVGFSKPYIILSRSDSLETRLESIALCSVYVHRSDKAKKEKRAEQAVTPEKKLRVLAVNPGSTSIKLAVYENEQCLLETEMAYETAAIDTEEKRSRQVRKISDLAKKELIDSGFTHIDAIAGRGGFMPRPDGKLAGGTYCIAQCLNGHVEINQQLHAAVMKYPQMDHASNLGIPVAAELACHFAVPAYTVDPVIVDEFSPIAEISGYAPITRKSTSHALNIRQAARRAAKSLNRPLDQMNLVIAHLGGGMTIASMVKGKMVDNSIALLGGGPFTPQRAGQLPTDELIDLCYSGEFTKDQLKQELSKRGGLVSYLGEDRMEVIEERIDQGDQKARQVVQAMIYQIARAIGAAYVGAGCNLDAIILTGGLSRSKLITKELRRQVGRLAPVIVFAGSLEMEALAAGTIAVMTGKEKICSYTLPEKQ